MSSNILQVQHPLVDVTRVGFPRTPPYMPTTPLNTRVFQSTRPTKSICIVAHILLKVEGKNNWRCFKITGRISGFDTANCCEDPQYFEVLYCGHWRTQASRGSTPGVLPLRAVCLGCVKRMLPAVGVLRPSVLVLLPVLAAH